MDSSQISTIIGNTINDFFYKFFSSIDNSLYSALDEFTFIDCDILQNKHFINILGTTAKNNILLIANSLIFGYLIYYSFKLIFSHLGITQVENPRFFFI